MKRDGGEERRRGDTKLSRRDRDEVERHKWGGDEIEILTPGSDS